MRESSGRVSLQDAVRRFQREPGSWGNSYNWFRAEAQRSGRVSLGLQPQFEAATIDVPVMKVKGRWTVDAGELEEALKVHRRALGERHQITQDLAQHVLHGEPGSRLSTDFGGYERHVDFHRVWDSVPLSERGGDSWICSRCWASASLEHGRQECHLCADWSGCGRDCTLSRVSCRQCGTSMPV